jgi:hypothetical protein
MARDVLRFLNGYSDILVRLFEIMLTLIVLFANFEALGYRDWLLSSGDTSDIL